MANILVTVASNVGKYLAGPVIREIQYLLCVNNVINDLENEKEALTDERDNLLTRIAQAEERTEVIEKPVEKWLTDVENLLREVEVLVQRTETDSNCFQGWFPTCGRYLLCKQMVLKIEAMGKFKGKSNDIQPFSHLALLPGIQYHSSEDFIYFGSRQKAYDELFETLKDDFIHMIGLYGEGGSGKTTLVIEVGNKVDKLNIFDMIISITVSQTPNIRDIQGEIADMLNLKLEEESERGRAQRLWLSLKEKKRILVIVDGLWRIFNLKDIGLSLNSSNKGAWKIIVTTHDQDVCTLMNCQKKIHLEILSEDESWTWFQELANIDDDISNSMDGVPREVCDECKGLPIAIKVVASSLKGKQKPKWELALANLRDIEAFDDHEGIEKHVMNCLKLSYDYLPRPETKQLFLLCPLYPEGYRIPAEDLMRYALGLPMGERLLLQSRRSFIETDINKLLESGLLMRGSVKMHEMVRDTALWIANRSDNSKILVNVDKPLSIVANDNRLRYCFAVSSWWYNEDPSFCQLHAPNLKILLVNITAHSSLNSLDLSPLTFEGIQGLQVFSLTINYKIVPISFPPSIQLLSNVRTLRLNGLKLGDISYIASLPTLEVLDMRRCYFDELPIGITNLKSLKLLDLSECHFLEKTYNGAIGKCSQLEEVYASKCYPLKYGDEIIMDICILLNLQRFVLGDPIIPERTRVLHVNDLNISKLRTSNKNILQIAETISLKGLHGGCKNVIPDMVGVVGGVNSLSSLHLKDCEEIECIFDATYDFKEDDLIPRLVELRLKSMYNLTELCHGPPLQVLHYFEKLEVLAIDRCRKLHIIFPRQCNLRNIKILSLSYCRTGEVLFSESVARSLQQLEQLTLHGCSDLKHLIAASGSEHGGYSNEEIIPASMNSNFFMTNIRDVNIYNCQRLESIFPICYVEGLPRLQKMDISHAPKLEYVFGKCDQEHLSSHQYKNHVMLPQLEDLNLICLYNLIGLCPEYYQAKWPSQSIRILHIWGCPKLAIAWFNLKVGYDPRQHRPNEVSTHIEMLYNFAVVFVLFSLIDICNTTHLNIAFQIWSFQCLQYLTMGNCEELKCLLSMKTHRSLTELVYIHIFNCQELEQIVAEDEEHVQLPNDELYFPKLKQITVYNCNKLKSLFPLSMVTMLPQLSILDLSRATQLQEVFRYSQGDDVMNELETLLLDLTEITLADLPNFVDICHGSKLDPVKLQELSISNCPKYFFKLKEKQGDFLSSLY
ncbi:disease resistance protein [Trifolium repens]|nr:disease resistance protein [Trifolium repens]